VIRGFEAHGNLPSAEFNMHAWLSQPPFACECARGVSFKAGYAFRIECRRLQRPSASALTHASY